MNTPERRPRRSGGDMAFTILSVVMGIIYVGIGGVIAFFPADFLKMGAPYKQLFGLVIALYGVFRFYRVFSKNGRAD
jgi:uncharacterized membrane protein